MTNHLRRKLIAGATLAPWLGAMTRPAGAQSWPARPIQMMIPAPAGGGVDVTARRLCEGMGRALGTQVVAVNRPGAAGLIGAQAVSSAPPDGYTVGYLHSGHIVLNAMEGKPDMVADFTPLAMFSASQFCIAVAPDAPYATLNDLLAAIQKNPGKLNFGAGGNGSPGHIAWEKLAALKGGLVVVQIPFKGAVEAAMAVSQGQVDFLSGVFSTALTVARTGRLRILAVTGARRSSQLPEVPTVAEAAGLPAYEHVSWGALFGPKGLPAPIVSRLYDAIRTTAESDAFKDSVITSGGEIMLSPSPQSLAALVKRELAETVTLVDRLGLRKS